MSNEVLVAKSALMEVGMSHLAEAIVEGDLFGLPFPSFVESRFRFFNGSMTPDEQEAAQRAFLLAHHVHDRTAWRDPDGGGIWCPRCDALIRADD